METTQNCKPNFAVAEQRRWTDAEERYLMEHRTDGSELIAHALGRSESSVQAKASRLGLSLRFEDGDLCPVCGTRQIRANGPGAKHGMCPTCWKERKTRALAERNAELAAQRAYEVEKYRGRRIKNASKAMPAVWEAGKSERPVPKMRARQAPSEQEDGRAGAGTQG